MAVRSIVAQARPRTPWQRGLPRERRRPSSTVPVIKSLRRTRTRLRDLSLGRCHGLPVDFAYQHAVHCRPPAGCSGPACPPHWAASQDVRDMTRTGQATGCSSRSVSSIGPRGLTRPSGSGPASQSHDSVDSGAWPIMNPSDYVKEAYVPDHKGGFLPAAWPVLEPGFTTWWSNAVLKLTYRTRVAMSS